MLLSVAINQSWTLFQLDIKNALLYGDLIKQVLMKQSLRYVAQGENKVCMLKKAIYRHKQSPRAWFKKLSRVVTDGGFHKCTVDHSVFYRKTSGGCVVLVVYVDDILLTRSDAVAISDTKKIPEKIFCHQGYRQA